MCHLPKHCNALNMAKKMALLRATGTLPSAWGTEGHFPALMLLSLSLTNLTGSLPPSWGGQGAFPTLEVLDIGFGADGISHLSGTLPYEWGNAAAFQQVKTLAIANCNITGSFLQLGQPVSVS